VILVHSLSNSSNFNNLSVLKVIPLLQTFSNAIFCICGMSHSPSASAELFALCVIMLSLQNCYIHLLQRLVKYKQFSVILHYFLTKCAEKKFQSILICKVSHIMMSMLSNSAKHWLMKTVNFKLMLFGSSLQHHTQWRLGVTSMKHNGNYDKLEGTPQFLSVRTAK